MTCKLLDIYNKTDRCIDVLTKVDCPEGGGVIDADGGRVLQLLSAGFNNTLQLMLSSDSQCGRGFLGKKTTGKKRKVCVRFYPKEHLALLPKVMSKLSIWV